MDIFTTFDNRIPSTKPKNSKKAAVSLKSKNQDKSRSLRPPKEQLSPQEIRDRVSLKGKKPVEKKVEVQVPQKEEEVVVEKEDHLLKSDIAKNSPDDPNTQEKLKSILKQGGFKFSDKEKSVLSQILADE